MSEGISENLAPKEPELIKRVGNFIRGLDPRERRKRKLRERIRILSDEKENEPSTLPTLEQNIRASEVFIRALRKRDLYHADENDLQYMKSDLGFQVEKGVGVEKGFFDVASVVQNAEYRYQLPLAIYVDRNHARLLVKGPYDTSSGRTIKVYDPMLSGFEEIKVNNSGEIVGLYSNSLGFEKRARNQNDLTALFESPELARFKNLLTNVKTFSFQRDFYNCIPYCLFVGAMLNGLEPGATEFKRRGIEQFEQDFGVRILTREDMLPK